jgi:hypothetical protein
LLKALTKVVAQPVKEQMVGELLMSKVNWNLMQLILHTKLTLCLIFLQMQQFYVYTNYCINQPHANELLLRLKKKSSVQRAIEVSLLTNSYNRNFKFNHWIFVGSPIWCRMSRTVIGGLLDQARAENLQISSVNQGTVNHFP